MCCYRRDDAVDPEIYGGAVIATLCDYPEPVVLEVTDPRRGIPAREKWLPSIAEVRQACEARMRPIRDQMARQKREAERAKSLPAPQEDRAAAMARLRARYPEAFSAERAAADRARVELADLCRAHAAAVDDLPDRPGHRSAGALADAAAKVLSENHAA